MIIKMFRWLLLALFVPACNDNDRSAKKEEMTSISPQSPTSPPFTPYSSPACPDDSYKEIYSQPEGPDGIAFRGTPFFEFPEPKAPEQKKYWVEVSRYQNGTIVRGYINALEEGQVDISALINMGLEPKGEIGLFIGDQKDAIKVFSAQNSRFVGHDDNGNKQYEIQASAPVKAGEKILFKDVKWPYGSPTNVKICFKPKK